MRKLRQSEGQGVEEVGWGGYFWGQGQVFGGDDSQVRGMSWDL